MTESKPCSDHALEDIPRCGNHQWLNKTFIEPNFKVAYGAQRTCATCGIQQFASFCGGPGTGGWIDYVKPKSDSTLDK